MFIEADIDADDNFVYSLKTRPQEILLDPKTGRPKIPTLIGEYRPLFEATPGNSRTIMLSVHFRSGQIWAPGASGNTKAPENIAGWSFHMEVRVDFTELQNEVKGIRTRVLEKRLNEFTSRGFAVSQLFCDFQSVDLLGTGASVKTTSDTAASVTTMFKNCLIDGYLAELKKNPERNPYTLGYVATPPPLSAIDVGVPDSLNPIGNTFNVYYDADYPQNSTLNFILNTKDSALPLGSHPFPDSFDERWISVNSVCDGKMAYSFRALIETMVLEKFYEDYSQSMHKQISDGQVEIGPSKTYEEAKQKAPLSRYYFDVHNQHEGINNENRYVTNFEASWSNTPSGFSVKIQGFIYWYKEKTKYVPDLLGRSKRARAWVGCKTNWHTSIDVNLQSNGTERPVLDIVVHPITVDSNEPIKGQNGVAKDYSSFGEILGNLLDLGGIFSLFTNKWFISGLLALNLVKLPKKLVVGNIQLDVALKNISDVAASTIFLPAGDVFHYRNLEVSGGGVTSMLVDYKQEL